MVSTHYMVHNRYDLSATGCAGLCTAKDVQGSLQLGLAPTLPWPTPCRISGARYSGVPGYGYGLVKVRVRVRQGFGLGGGLGLGLRVGFGLTWVGRGRALGLAARVGVDVRRGLGWS